MGEYFCPDCSWQGQEEKNLPSVPCPICGRSAMSLDLPEDHGEARTLDPDSTDDGTISLQELEEQDDDLDDGELER